MLHDHIISQTTPISTFCVAFRIFLVGERRDLKFGVEVEQQVPASGQQIIPERGELRDFTERYGTVTENID